MQRPGAERLDGYGLKFHVLGQETVDRLADALYNMTVPEIFARLSQPSWTVRIAQGRGRPCLRQPAARAPRYRTPSFRLRIRNRQASSSRRRATSATAGSA